MTTTLKTALVLLTSFFLLTGCDSSETETNMLPGDPTLLGLSQYDQVDLNSTQKESLAYMWNEEKMAYDLYLALGKKWSITLLPKIAKMSEIVHIQYVEELVEWYDINISNADFNASYSAEELDALLSGEFTDTVPEVAALYTDLKNYAVGVYEAYQVGCMVEVTDVNDLNNFMAEVPENDALIDTFMLLRAGSYNHYWEIHNAMIAAGYPDGCAFVYDSVDYNKTGEYPMMSN